MPRGTELPDLNVARREAVKLVGRMLEDHPGQFWAGGGWRAVFTGVRN